MRLPVTSNEIEDQRATYLRRLKTHSEDEPRQATVPPNAVEKHKKTMVTLHQVKIELATPTSKTPLKKN